MIERFFVQSFRHLYDIFVLELPSFKASKVLKCANFIANMYLADEIRRYFELNPETGTLQTAAPLDHETAAEFLLNVGATAGSLTGNHAEDDVTGTVNMPTALPHVNMPPALSQVNIPPVLSQVIIPPMHTQIKIMLHHWCSNK